MRTFKYNVDGRELSFTVSELHGTVTQFTVDGEQPVLSEEKMAEVAAVAALGLLQYELEVVHDDEEGIITLDAHRTAWNNPSTLMNPWKAK